MMIIITSNANIKMHRKHMLLVMNLLSDGNFAKMGEFVEMR